MKKQIAILYICTGKYIQFWDDFYNSCEQHLLVNESFSKEYFVFTDADSISHESNKHVHKVYQEALEWPYITLLRFKIFNQSKALYKDVDYLYFFNANMLLVSEIGIEFLPSSDKELCFLQHPGFFGKQSKHFTYERNMNSLAGIKYHEGMHYFAGGLNGGRKEAYLKMSNILEHNIDIDLKKNLIALWHDESHLNRYAIDNEKIVQTLLPSYGYPKGWDIPFEKKILIRDKTKYGGHAFLRGDKTSWVRKIFSWLKK